VVVHHVDRPAFLTGELGSDNLDAIALSLGFALMGEPAAQRGVGSKEQTMACQPRFTDTGSIRTELRMMTTPPQMIGDRGFFTDGSDHGSLLT
jgi:hypothetical protein